MAKKTTLCINCEYLINLEPDSVRCRIWYNHLCRAMPRKQRRSVYDGKFEGKAYEYCRDVNKGNCKHFYSQNPAQE